MADNNVLTYDSATSTWKAEAPAGGSSLLTIAAKTASYTLTASDQMVTFNGASLTATLPDPTTVTSGTVLRVKNIHTSALTVVSAGTSKTIDAAASYNVPQYQILTVVSDAVTWHIVATSDVVQIQASLPTDSSFTRGSAVVIHKDNWPYLRRGTGTASWNVHTLGFTSQTVTKTTSQTLAYSETVVLFNGSNLTCTLPNAGTSGMTGRHYVVKNIHTTPLTVTVVSGGGIDGQTSITLYQYDKIRVVSDGSVWHITEGRKQVSTSTTAPTNPAEGDIWFDIS